MDFIRENKTAFYVFNTSTVIERINLIRRIFNDKISLAYAVKANSFIIKDIIPYIDRFEICSPGEFIVCNEQGVHQEKSVISGVYKDPDFIERLISSDCGRIYTIESVHQFELLKSLSEKYSRKLKILLRLTNDSQFGINKEEVEWIIQNRENYSFLDIMGIQYFSGTQKTSLKKFKREICMLQTLIVQLKDDYKFDVSELEYGPGFPIDYFGDSLFHEDELYSYVKELLSGLGSSIKITLELGRSIAASCGKYYAHVVDIKKNNGQNYILTDGGMHHIVYFGQYMGMKIPQVSIVGKETIPVEDEYTICGALCSMNDIMAKQVSLPRIDIGDILCFENTGAYCMTECYALFLSREIPAVYIIHKDQSITCARKPIETYILNMPSPEVN